MAIEPETFTQYREFLEENIDPDSGLLDKLRTNRTLSLKEISDIKGQTSFYKRNTLLLQYITDKQKYDCLINALRETKQTHLVNYLIGNGDYNPEKISYEWPLTDKELSILDANHEVLVKLIELDELIGGLYSKDVINWIQRDAISSKPTSYDKNEAFLDILRRRNLKDFQKTIRCLHESKQSHIAQILSQGGVVVRIHAEGLSETTEDDIIEHVVNVLNDRPLEESRRILEGTLKNLIALKKGESIVLYVYCETVTKLANLHEMQTSGQLKKCIQKLFTQMLSAVKNTEVTVDKLQVTELLYRSLIKDMDATLSKEEYNRCRSYFSGGIKLRAVRDFSPKEMTDAQENQLKDILKSLKPERMSSELLNSNTMALSFKKGDQMETILPEDIGDVINWWKVRHIESGDIGYILRNLVVIDYELQLNQRCNASAESCQAANMKEVTSNTSHIIRTSLEKELQL